jgi:cytochrome P450
MITKFFIKRFTGNKRPPGPTLNEMKKAMSLDEAFGALTFPVNLTKKYGDIIYLKSARQYLITGPLGFEHILKTNASNYTKCNLFYGRMKPLFGESLLVTDGPYWKHRRTISQPAFQMAMIKNYVPIIQECCESLIETLKRNPKNKHNVSTLMNSLILNITFKLFCGKSLSDTELKDLGESISFSNWHVSHSLLIKPWFLTFNNLRFYHHIHRLDRFLLAIIQERRQQQPVFQPADLLQLLMTAPNETGSGTLSDQDILAEFKTLLLTGHETTGCGLTWMLYLLAQYPEHRYHVEQELDEVLNGRCPALNDYHELTILKAVLNETFRLYPPIWAVARTNTEEDIIGNYNISPKSLIVLNLYALHRNPNYWEQPNSFYPPRFFGDNDKIRHPFAYLPFSSGPRTCIASHFANIESILVAAILLTHCRFEKIPQTKAHPEPCISLRPKKGLWMKIEPR